MINPTIPFPSLLKVKPYSTTQSQYITTKQKGKEKKKSRERDTTALFRAFGLWP